MRTTMTALVAITFGAAASAVATLPAAADGSPTVGDLDSRSPTIETIVRDWDQYGFVAPVKPAQMWINGRNGATIRGADYATALSIIRQGAAPMREGRSADSVASARFRTDR